MLSLRVSPEALNSICAVLVGKRCAIIGASRLGGPPACPAKIGFERGALFGVGAAVDINAAGAAALRHRARRGEGLHRVESGKIGFAVTAAVDVEGQHHVAMALGRADLGLGQQTGAEQFAVAGLEILALDFPAFVGHR